MQMVNIESARRDMRASKDLFRAVAAIPIGKAQPLDAQTPF
ncbi:hypothetical protein EIO_0442 [Ketogulonicigenium vulgare Y25]|uniref:Uncharacterized protein n=1 Tax=Ketogulonicigenium vulgare (strain WSH-001) TaxID=759362 RepID=F9Y780_KETVW|nr:hypothetical protein EIO_0442 [Ketogulonicigenium vulgare Y25]AEM39847.1 hypothetical protein KVU_0008 [Ketogulonicigenium vulgare WSH-001]ALJ80062.1 hypothetical protein KVH_02055 [Ketogulonicigenium vulgare]ANW34867.1 hypothetical protein KvSKV_02055 [Ketogulonicigenium vulgare]